MLQKVCVTLALYALVSACAAATPPEEVFRSARLSMVKLVAHSAEGRTFFGSGVALPDGRLVTNCHVTRLAQRINLLLGGDAGANVDAQTDDVTHDLCVLSLGSSRMQPASLRNSRSLKIGETVYAIGFNRGMGLTYQSGQVSELFEHDGGMVIRTTAAFTTGASGGGLFDADGHLVGILTFVRLEKNKDSSYFALPLEWLHADLPGKPVAPLDGVPFWAESPERQPRFLRAKQLETDARWDELVAMAREWSERSPDDGHAWQSLGMGLRKFGDEPAAAAAFQRAAERGVTDTARH
jgi:hypothetical protein